MISEKRSSGRDSRPLVVGCAADGSEVGWGTAMYLFFSKGRELGSVSSLKSRGGRLWIG